MSTIEPPTCPLASIEVKPVSVAEARAGDAPARSLGWRLKTALLRWKHHEFWPAKVFYVPLLPWLAWLCLRHGRPLAFLAVNPGIENGGGLINESKARIMRGLKSPWTCATYLVEARAGDTARTRAERALAIMRENEAVSRFPVILKPDTGQRGFGLKLARSESDVREYFETVARPAIVQQYHPGPQECGILWVRHGATIAARGTRRSDGSVMPQGFIFAVTRKTFPVLTGDGESTLEDLIVSHPRFRCQAETFLSRWRNERGRVLARGEHLRLAEAGNHCQGTLFSDGADLITPELSAVIDDLCARFPLDPDDEAAGAGGLDFGRFDIRYESDELLRQGKGFGIVELNGSSAEATNLYDPARSRFWAYGVLFRQWSHLYALGAARLAAGWGRPSLASIRAAMRDHYESRDGSAISD